MESNALVPVLIIAAILLLANVVVTVVAALRSRRLEKDLSQQSSKIAKQIEDQNKVKFIWGERETFDELVKLVLQEPSRIRATRFNPQQIQKSPRYVDATFARVLGNDFEGTTHGRLERYHRLTALNSVENRDSLIQLAERLLAAGCRNAIFKVTADKNDFEIVIGDRSRSVLFCFHDSAKESVLHSGILSRDVDTYEKFSEMFELLWKEDILLTIDFSRGRQHVEEAIEQLRQLEPIAKTGRLSPIEDTIAEAEAKVRACRAVLVSSIS